jgi:hypothetical protein
MENNELKFLMCVVGALLVFALFATYQVYTTKRVCLEHSHTAVECSE